MDVSFTHLSLGIVKCARSLMNLPMLQYRKARFTLSLTAVKASMPRLKQS